MTDRSDRMSWPEWVATATLVASVILGAGSHAAMKSNPEAEYFELSGTSMATPIAATRADNAPLPD